MKTKQRKLTAAEKAYRAIQELGIAGRDRDVEFIANVIFCHCSKRTTRLKNLKRLIEDGYEVRTAQFELFKIRIEGELLDIGCLDNIESIKTRVEAKRKFYQSI